MQLPSFVKWLYGNQKPGSPPIVTRNSIEGGERKDYIPPKFPMGPFVKHEQNPIFGPMKENPWESAYVYNAAAITVDEHVFLLYRAQGPDKVSSIGLAWSTDGYNFDRLDYPILEATEPWEIGGGVEDPRVVRIDGIFYMTYTAYDGRTPRLALATSENLINWRKYPPLWEAHSKSGAIFVEPGRDGQYAMIWGDKTLQLARTKDLTHWKKSSFDRPFAKGQFPWESKLIESGPAPIKSSDGENWIFIYNAATRGTNEYPAGQYFLGQMLLNYNDLEKGPLARLETPFLVPQTEEELHGQVDRVVFCEGLVQFKGKWFLYFGQSDEVLGVAIADAK